MMKMRPELALNRNGAKVPYVFLVGVIHSSVIVSNCSEIF